MKKRITALLLTVVMLVSFTCVALAVGGVELPMVPIGSTSAVNVKLSSDADEFVYNGGSVKYTTEISEIGTDGLSRADLEYTYSDGLVFSDDVKVIGLPEGWTVSEPSIGNNKLVFTVFDEIADHFGFARIAMIGIEIHRETTSLHLGKQHILQNSIGRTEGGTADFKAWEFTLQIRQNGAEKFNELLIRSLPARI